MENEAIGLARKSINEFGTDELVCELSSRIDALEHSRLSRSAKASIEVEGPADVLVVRAL